MDTRVHGQYSMPESRVVCGELEQAKCVGRAITAQYPVLNIISTIAKAANIVGGFTEKPPAGFPNRFF